MKWSLFKSLLSDIKAKEEEKSTEHDVVFLILDKEQKASQISCGKQNFLEVAWRVYENLNDIIRFDVSINDKRKNYTELLYRYIEPSIHAALNNMPNVNHNSIVQNWKTFTKEKRKVLSEMMLFQVKELI